jgi:hypothetical protein
MACFYTSRAFAFVRRLEKKIVQLELLNDEWKRRALRAEAELREKRVDSEKGKQERDNLRRETDDLKAQLIDVQGHNCDREQTIWSAR